MFTTFFTGALRSYIAGIMAMSMTLTSSLTGPAKNYTELSLKTLENSVSAEEITIGLEVDVAAIEEVVGESFGLPELPGVYEDGKIDVSAKIYAFSDLDEFRAIISLGENPEESPAVYIDMDGIALNAAATETVFMIADLAGASEDSMSEVYTKYFDGEGMYFTWAELLEFDADYLDEFINEEQMKLLEEIINDVIAVISKEDNVKVLADAYAPLFDLVEPYFSETTVDGVKAYSEKISGSEMFALVADVFEFTYSEESAEAIYEYIVELLDDIDYTKYIAKINEMLPEEEKFELPEGVSNEIIYPMIKAYLDTTIKDEFIEYFVSSGEPMTEVIEIFDIIASGEDKDGKYPEIAEYLPLISTFLDNSYAESVIYEKDGAITENSKLVIGDGKNEYVTLSMKVTVKEYDGKIISAAEAVPFDKRVEFVEIDNKMGYEAAVEKGVHSIEITWDADMSPEDEEVEIRFPYFCVNYNSSMIESIKKDPAFAELDEETQALILGMYEDTDYEFKYCDTTAHLVENSVYLPLRQIMENAGYEVSWDGEARKAYVNVDGNKIEMTGIIIDDRTYVKVRDFEKLGATVEYEEEFYYEDAYNDFSKSCYATITFGK